MGHGIYVPKLLIDHLSIDLGGRDICMAQHFLNGFQIRTVFQQVDSKGMPQGVRGNVLVDACLILIAFDNLPKALEKPLFSLI